MSGINKCKFIFDTFEREICKYQSECDQILDVIGQLTTRDQLKARVQIHVCFDIIEELRYMQQARISKIPADDILQ